MTTDLNKKAPNPVSIDGFVIDATLTEEHTYESEVTQYPVEKGSDITDNVRALPRRVRLDGIVSDTPLPPVIDMRGDRDPDDNGLLFRPSDDALALLEAIYTAREPVTIQSSLKRFENMVMQDLQIPRDPQTGLALRFEATFQEVVIVTNQRTQLRVSVPNAAGKQNLGHKPAKDSKRGTDGKGGQGGKDGAAAAKDKVAQEFLHGTHRPGAAVGSSSAGELGFVFLNLSSGSGKAWDFAHPLTSDQAIERIKAGGRKDAKFGQRGDSTASTFNRFLDKVRAAGITVTSFTYTPG